MSGTPARYTLIDHAMVDSPAARCLSGNGYALLIDFIRLWERETRSGKRQVPHVAFTHSGYGRILSRDAFDRARRELEEKGFLDSISKRWGLYRLSRRWKAYKPTRSERAKLPKTVCMDSKQTSAWNPDKRLHGKPAPTLLPNTDTNTPPSYPLAICDVRGKATRQERAERWLN